MSKGQEKKKKMGIHVTVFLAQIADYSLVRNLNRVHYLVTLARDIYNQGEKGCRSNSKEILRSATVLIHASLEDTLRFTCRTYLKKDSKEVINKIPLVNSQSKGRGEKFLLGDLIPFKGKTVDTVIAESIMAFYNDHVSFSSTNDIATHLGYLSIDVSEVNEYFTELDSLIKRRHSIVHQADLIGSNTAGRIPAPISQADVVRWISITDKFCMKVFKVLSGNKYRRSENSMLTHNKIEMNY